MIPCEGTVVALEMSQQGPKVLIFPKSRHTYQRQVGTRSPRAPFGWKRRLYIWLRPGPRWGPAHWSAVSVLVTAWSALMPQHTWKQVTKMRGVFWGKFEKISFCLAREKNTEIRFQGCIQDSNRLSLEGRKGAPTYSRGQEGTWGWKWQWGWWLAGRISQCPEPPLS